MSILIKDMKMPKDGAYWCEINVAGKIATITIHGEDRKSFRLVPVPPHGRLIDVNALLNAMKKAGEDDSEIADVYEQDYTVVSGWIYTAPTVIPADKDGET